MVNAVDTSVIWKIPRGALEAAVETFPADKEKLKQVEESVKYNRITRAVLFFTNWNLFTYEKWILGESKMVH